MGQRTIAVLALLAAPALAIADAPAPAWEPPPRDAPYAVLRAMVIAKLRYDRGEPGETIAALEPIRETIPLAELDLALAHELDGRIDHAIEAYRRYVAAAPKARNRALVEKRIDQLEHHTPRLAHLGLRFTYGQQPSDEAAILILNGVVIGPSPATRALPNGTYRIERVSPTTFARQTVSGYDGNWDVPMEVDLIAEKLAGNVIFDGMFGSFSLDDGPSELVARMPISAGKHRLTSRDCKSLAFTVAPPPALTFVEIKGCSQATITTKQLAVPWGKK